VRWRIRCSKGSLGTADNLKYLATWIFCTKMVKLTPYFLREPQDLIMLPGYFVFAYFHSLIKLYAGLTFWETNWGGRNLSAINNRPDGSNDNDDDANDSSDDSVDGGVQLPPTPPSSRRRKTAGSSSSSSGADDGSNAGRTIRRAGNSSGPNRVQSRTSTVGTRARRKTQAQPMTRLPSSSTSSTSSSTSSRWRRCPGCRKLHSDPGSVCQVRDVWGR
jgi:hypothetical protein